GLDAIGAHRVPPPAPCSSERSQRGVTKPSTHAVGASGSGRRSTESMTQTLGAPPTVRVGPVPWWLRGGHLETIVPSVLGPPLPTLVSERRLVEVEPGTSLETWLSRPPLEAPSR